MPRPPPPAFFRGRSVGSGRSAVVVGSGIVVPLSRPRTGARALCSRIVAERAMGADDVRCMAAGCGVCIVPCGGAAPAGRVPDRLGGMATSRHGGKRRAAILGGCSALFGLRVSSTPAPDCRESTPEGAARARDEVTPCTIAKCWVESVLRLVRSRCAVDRLLLAGAI